MSVRFITIFFFLFMPSIAFSHVKWFSEYDFNQAPLRLESFNHPSFWGLLTLSLVSLPLLVGLDHLAEKSSSYKRINSYLDRFSNDGPLIMRVAMGAVLLMSWQADSIIAPEIPIPSPTWGWIEFFLALLLLSRTTTIFTGLGVVVLWFFGISEHGIFHMLDYVVYPAVGLYLVVTHLKSRRLGNLDLPILYSGLGFSLCWVAFEKIFYPYWGLSVLGQAPALTMGLDHDFFLLACAFIEFTLGYLLIICLLHRPLAIVVTLTFFTTTLFFGKTEVVGHTILHGALLVFIVKGPGYYYQAPIRWHKSAVMRSLFASVNFIILFFGLGLFYHYMSQKTYTTALAEKQNRAHLRFDLPASVKPPSLALEAHRDAKGGWNVYFKTSNFIFSPQKAGLENVPGEGHAHLYINGEKTARVYGDWFHLILKPGVSKIRAVLNTNDHQEYFVDGKPVDSVIELKEDREVSDREHAH